MISLVDLDNPYRMGEDPRNLEFYPGLAGLMFTESVPGELLYTGDFASSF